MAIDNNLFVKNLGSKLNDMQGLQHFKCTLQRFLILNIEIGCYKG